MKKIKICHVIGDFVNGGVESVIYNYFSHMDLSRFDVHIIGHGIKVQECADRFINMGFTLHTIIPKRESFCKNLSEMEAIFRKEKFDIVHSHLTEWACVPMFLAWKCNVKVRINHSHMAERPCGLKNKVYYGLRLWLGKLFATDYFACGYDAGRYLFGEKTFCSGKVTIIPNAIDLQKFKYDEAVRKKIRNGLQINDETVVIGHVGRFFKQKNHTFLVDIYEQYRQINPNSILLLLGDGELKYEIMEKVQQKKLMEHVYFLGVKSNINEWYQAMDVFLLPSLFEGLPVVGVEAQASGVVCFFSDTITDEIAISPFTKFISIKKTAKQWACVINENIEHYNRTEITLNKRYDINECACKLEDFYLTRGSWKTQE